MILPKGIITKSNYEVIMLFEPWILFYNRALDMNNPMTCLGAPIPIPKLKLGTIGSSALSYSFKLKSQSIRKKIIWSFALLKDDIK